MNYKEQELQDQEFYLNREQFELNKRESTIKKRESRLDERESNLEAEIDTASEQKIAKEKQRLHDEYTTKLAEDRQNDEITLKEQLEAKKAKLQEEYNKEAIKWDKIKATMPKIVVLIVFLVLIVCCFTYCQNRVRDENKALEKANKKLEAELEEQNEKVDNLIADIESSEANTQSERQYYVCVNPCVGDKESFDSGKMMPFSEGKEVWIVNKTDTYYQLAIELRDDLFLEKDLFEQNFVPKEEYE